MKIYSGISWLSYCFAVVYGVISFSYLSDGADAPSGSPAASSIQWSLQSKLDMLPNSNASTIRMAINENAATDLIAASDSSVELWRRMTSNLTQWERQILQKHDGAQIIAVSINSQISAYTLRSEGMNDVVVIYRRNIEAGVWEYDATLTLTSYHNTTLSSFGDSIGLNSANVLAVSSSSYSTGFIFYFQRNEAKSAFGNGMWEMVARHILTSDVGPRLSYWGNTLMCIASLRTMQFFVCPANVSNCDDNYTLYAYFYGNMDSDNVRVGVLSQVHFALHETYAAAASQSNQVGQSVVLWAYTGGAWVLDKVLTGLLDQRTAFSPVSVFGRLLAVGPVAEDPRLLLIDCDSHQVRQAISVAEDMPVATTPLRLSSHQEVLLAHPVARQIFAYRDISRRVQCTTATYASPAITLSGQLLLHQCVDL